MDAEYDRLASVKLSTEHALCQEAVRLSGQNIVGNSLSLSDLLKRAHVHYGCGARPLAAARLQAAPACPHCCRLMVAWCHPSSGSRAEPVSHLQPPGAARSGLQRGRGADEA